MGEPSIKKAGDESSTSEDMATESWTRAVDRVMEKTRTRLLEKGYTAEQIAADEAELRHFIAHEAAAMVRTTHALLPNDEAERSSRRVEAELKNLERYEDHMAEQIKLREARRNSWVPKAAFAIACTSLAWQIIAALWHLK